jgi:hypothetical protein
MNDLRRVHIASPRRDFAPEGNFGDFLALLPYIPSIIFFIIGYLFFTFSVFKWLKTAEWPVISVHHSLEKIGLVGSDFQFNFTGLLGIQKIFNEVLASSSTFTCFILSIILFYFGLGIVQYIDQIQVNSPLIKFLKENICRYKK